MSRLPIPRPFPILAVAASLVLCAACDVFDDDDADSGAANLAPSDGELAALLNQRVILPVGSFPAPDATDDVRAEVTSFGLTPTTLRGGSTATASLSYATDGSVVVTGVAVGFGVGETPPSRLTVVPFDTGGAVAGDIEFQFSVPVDFCTQVSSICHQVRFYEYLVVDGERIVQGGPRGGLGVQDVGFSCGDCDTPSCQALLSECTEPVDCDPACGEGRTCVQGTCVEDGALRFTLIWDAALDFDLHVITPADEEVFWGNPVAGGCRLDVDDRDGGPNAVESIRCDDASEGTYRFFVVNFSQMGNEPARLEVVRPSGLVLFQRVVNPGAGQTQVFELEL